MAQFRAVSTRNFANGNSVSICERWCIRAIFFLAALRNAAFRAESASRFQRWHRGFSRGVRVRKPGSLNMVATAISSMCAALGANGPAQELAREDDIFGWLVGAWDLEVLDAESEGMHRVNGGEWHFAWVLEGRAIQDVLIAPKLAQRRDRLPVRGNRYGTGLRIYDDQENRWRGFWVNPIQASVEMLRIEKRGNDIVETSENACSVFSAIARESFCYSIQTKRGGTLKDVAQINARRSG
jgi:hypothetical protein